MNELNEKQKAFVDHYIICLNGTKAYMEAYPDTTYETAQTSSYRLLRNEQIKALISEKLKESEEMRDVTKERILREYKAIGFSNIFDYLNVDSEFIDLKDCNSLPEMQQRVVKEIEITKTYREDSGMEQKTKLKLHDKIKALETLSKYVKLVEEDEKKGPQKIEFILSHDNGKSNL